MKKKEKLAGFFGQAKIVAYIVRLAYGAIALGESFVDCLLAGASGLGKTELVRALSIHLGVGFFHVACSKKFDLEKLASLAKQLEPFDILFLDEAHSLTQEIQEAVYRMIVERKAPKFIKAGNGKCYVDGEIDIRPITVIAATDQPGALLPAFKKRLAETFMLSLYSLDEMLLIVRHRASQSKLLLSAQAARLLARACRGVPREAGHLLRSLRLFYHDMPENSEFTVSDVRKFLQARGVDESGLTKLDREYMAALAGAETGSVSLESLALQLGVDKNHIVKNIEPWLVKAGWVSIESCGRVLTRAGKKLTIKTN